MIAYDLDPGNPAHAQEPDDPDYNPGPDNATAKALWDTATLYDVEAVAGSASFEIWRDGIPEGFSVAVTTAGIVIEVTGPSALSARDIVHFLASGLEEMSK